VLWQKAVLLESLKLYPNISWVLAHHIKEQPLQVHEFSVVWVVFPSGDLNSILRLAAEIFPDVVDDYCLTKVTPTRAQVLDVMFSGTTMRVFDLHGVLAVKTVRD
jgi:hypothetical protein